MNKKFILYAILFLGVLLLLCYAYLGGFRPVEITVIEKPEYTLTGRYYEGSYDADSLARLFFEAKNNLKDNDKSGTLTIAHLSEPAADTVKSFIGILLKESDDYPPLDGFEKKVIAGGTVLRATINAHHLVMPTRTTVDERMQEFAKEKKLSLAPVVIEQYISDEELIIDRILE